MKYKAVIFDLFGTLAESFTESVYFKVLVDMVVILGVPADEFTRLWRDSFDMRAKGTHRTHTESIRYICEQIGVVVTDEQVERASDSRLAYSMNILVPRPATLPTINELKNLGFKVGLITDCSPETTKAWPDTAFAGVFDVEIFSCAVKMKKPDPGIYLLACERLGVKPEECVYVGDGGSNELTGAKQAGMYPVLICDPGENEDTYVVNRETGWNGPVIATLDEILEMLK